MFRWFYGDTTTKSEKTIENNQIEGIDIEYILVNGSKVSGPKVSGLIAELQKASAETKTKTPNPTKFRSPEFVAKLNAVEKVLSHPSPKMNEMLERSKTNAKPDVSPMIESTFKIQPSETLQDVHAELISKFKPPLNEKLKIIFLAGHYRSIYLKESYAAILKKGLENKIIANQQLNKQISANPDAKNTNSNRNISLRTR